MSRARDEEIRGPQGMAKSARGALFDCPFCIRPDDKRYRGPTIGEDGEPLEPWEVRDRYNQRRYRHLDEDFRNTHDLREHLVDRVHYWARDSDEKDALATGIQTVEATVEMLERRRDERAARARIEREKAKQLSNQFVAAQASQGEN